MTFLKRSLKVILCIFTIIAMFWWLCQYRILPGFWNGFFFFLLFFGVPLLAFILFRKNKGVRWYILAVLIAIMPLSLFQYTTLVRKTSFTYDESYLIGDSAFVENASDVMPSREMVKGGTTVFYECLLKGKYGISLYRLSVEYDKEAFESEVARLDEQYIEGKEKSSFDSDDFYLDGVFYKGYDFFNDTHYFMAYNACPDSCIVSYIFFCERDDLVTLSAGLTLEHFYDSNVYLPES